MRKHLTRLALIAGYGGIPLLLFILLLSSPSRPVRPDITAAGQWIRAGYQPGDLIVVVNKEDYRAFDAFYGYPYIVVDAEVRLDLSAFNRLWLLDTRPLRQALLPGFAGRRAVEAAFASGGVRALRLGASRR